MNVDAKEVENEEDKRNLESLQGKIEKFWNSVDKVILDSPSGTKIKDVATLPVVIKDSVVPEEDLKDVDQDKKVTFKREITIDEVGESLSLAINTRFPDVDIRWQFLFLHVIPKCL